MAEISNRFDRIVAIFIQLQSGRILKASDLAKRFGVSQRTIYRDIRSLEAAGVPILGEAGQGYKMMEGFKLPPVMFTREEAAGFVTAQKLVEKYADKGISEHFESAMLKIKSVLRTHDKDRVNTLESLIKIKNNRDKKTLPKSLSIILESIAEQYQVKILYEKPGSTEITERYIEPAGVFNEMSYWYVLAYCHLRKEYRQFRTDRIRNITLTSIKFTRQHNYEEEFSRLKIASDPEDKTEIIIKVDNCALPYLVNARNYFGFVDEEKTPTHTIMHFLACKESESLARWFLTFGDHAEIVGPYSFKVQVEKLLENIRIRITEGGVFSKAGAEF